MSTEYIALAEQLAQLEAQKAEVAAKLAASRDQVRTGLIDSIKAHIQSYGFAIEDIATAMLPKTKGAGKRKSTGTAKPATQYRDLETGNVYSKGRLPQWMRDGMLKAQLDPNDKASMKVYKETRMEIVEDAGEKPVELQEAA